MSGLEDTIQKNIIDAVRLYYPRSTIFSVPNGGHRSKVEAGILKATGALAGVSDLILVHEGQVYFFEVKTETGKQSDSQKLFEQKIHAQGLKYFIVHSARETLSIIQTIS